MNGAGYPYANTKISVLDTTQKMLTQMDHRPEFEIVKLLERNIGEYIYDLYLNRCLSDIKPKARSINTQFDKLGFTGIKNTCSSENAVERRKGKTQARKYFLKTIHLRIDLRNYNELSKFNNKKTAH